MSRQQPIRPKSRDDFEIAIFCALTFEADAILALFDHRWDKNEEGQSFGKADGDPNAYSTGAIGKHNVVLAHLPGTGKVAAANIAAFCRMSYLNISLAIVAGTCGGTPIYGKGKEILLGDVIISTGVVQYDLGKCYPDKFRTKDTPEDSLGRPSLELRSLLAKLMTNRHHEKLQIATQKHLQEVLGETYDVIDHPEGLPNILFKTNYRHKHQEPTHCTICAACNGISDPVCDVALSSSCKELRCDLRQLVLRSRLGQIDNNNQRATVGINGEAFLPMIHFGKFGSGDSVVKSGDYRDQLTASHGAIGFEMESAGVWELFQTVVIRGVSNYADCHKNDIWQIFAAASAAACTKAFLKHWESTRQETRSATEGQGLGETVIDTLHFSDLNETINNPTPPASITCQWNIEA
ncbi:hypothetical protein FPOA_03802 [Fusarium poae]|uniref:Nucleoside phosphorylase domain-containing protein n=1 Tax=Fusarium poae TaxID=36050 RepID=A0A1B8ARR7_FUSPO|nr:hypothetical protein FPOA_03802 [Fusarium poae]